jgi:hypothetical protein
MQHITMPARPSSLAWLAPRLLRRAPPPDAPHLPRGEPARSEEAPAGRRNAKTNPSPPPASASEPSPRAAPRGSSQMTRRGKSMPAVDTSDTARYQRIRSLQQISADQHLLGATCPNSGEK